MKKLKLGALDSGATEVLTRAQLKNVLGGGGSGGAGFCWEIADCPPGLYYCDRYLHVCVEASPGGSDSGSGSGSGGSGSGGTCGGTNYGDCASGNCTWNGGPGAHYYSCQ